MISFLINLFYCFGIKIKILETLRNLAIGMPIAMPAMQQQVMQGGEDCWRGPTYGADYAGAESNADDNAISGWHGGIIWTDQDYQLQRGDNNAPNLCADICRCLCICSLMPVPKWRGVRKGSEVLSQEDAAKIFGPLEGNWSMEFVNAEQLEQEKDRGYNQRFFAAEISSNQLTMAGGQHYWRKVTRRKNKPTGKSTSGNILDKRPGRKVQSGNKANPDRTLPMICIRPHPSVGEEENTYYIDGRGTVLVIRSETELLLKHFKGEGRYDVVLTKTDKDIGSLEMDEESE